MATQWMDDFQGYGTDSNRLNRIGNGPYADYSIDLQPDPDPTAGGKYVMMMTPFGLLRKVLTSAQTTVGVAARYWPNSQQPGGYNNLWASFRDVNNLTHVYVTVDPSGNLVVYRHDNGADVILGQTATPCIITNAWRHIETKVVIDPTAGSVQIRLEGAQVLNITGVRTTSNVAGAVNSCSSVAFGRTGNGSPVVYMKDLILWDGTTSLNNDFFGSCQVYRIIPAADVSRNWNTTIGASPPLNPASGSTTGGTLAANTYYYVVTAILNPQGESIASNEVSVTTTGTTSSVTLNWTAPAGMTVTGYKVYRGTAAGAENVYYSPGNVLTFTDTGAAGTAGTPPTDGGTGFDKINEVTPDDDGTFITAGSSPYPAAYQATMTQIPANVTSVKSVMVIHRSRKSDGGDAQLQASLISGANTAAGANRTITTAYTYWWDLFEQDPSGTNWNKTLVNALKLKLDRTV